MLQIEGLNFRYQRRQPPVLNDLQLQLKPGEIGVLLGPNGSGKTTLFKSILGILKPQGGSIRFEGEDLLKLSRRARARRVAYVPQDIRFGALSVLDSVLLGRLSHFGLSAGTADYQAVAETLHDLGLERFATRQVDLLSGGERQKVAIARALVQEPRLLVFDEPTGNLDIMNGQLMIRLAKKLARERGISILSSLHDLNQAMQFGDRLFLLKDGAVRYQVRPDELSADMIGDVFGADVRIIHHEGERIILGGKET